MDLPSIHSSCLIIVSRTCHFTLCLSLQSRAGLEPSAETDFNQNEGRRKRQRTRSPEPGANISVNLATSTRAEQPEAATSNIRTAIDNEANCINPGNEESTAHINGNLDSVEGHLQSKSSGNVAATVDGFGSESKDNGHPLCEVQDQNALATPPKKMLRVRPDGRLGSPKAKDPTQGVKRRRGRKSGKAEAFSNKLVVVIQYGEDDGSRRAIGRKLDEILLGAVSIQGPVKDNPSKPPEPLKPTHPFFLGGSALIASQPGRTTSNDPKNHESDAGVSKEQKKTISPRKARVTSKPPDIADNQARATPFGLGSHAFGSDHARVTRFPGAMEPIWPPTDMLHVGRPKESTLIVNNSMQGPRSTEPSRKLKGLEVRVPEREDVLGPSVNLVRFFQSNDRVFQKVNSRDWREFRRPKRRLMTGHELQKAIYPRLDSRLDTIENGDVDELSVPQPVHSPAHDALQHLYGTIATSLSSFDKFACERQDWMHKYAPKAAKDVLQQSHEVSLLRDWLKGSTIRSVEFRDNGNSSRASSVASRRRGPKKRKRAEELDGFVISSDEEASLMDEITDPESFQPRRSLLKKSVIRSADATGVPGTGGRSTNAVVISGPHGCGKTAAVYAVAQELGFEVFEINAASRRSGRDILDRVGDMTRNHLVRQDPRDEVAGSDETAEQQRASEQLKQDLESGRQGTMNSFFKSAKGIKSKHLAKKSSAQKVGPEPNEQPKKQQSQKQSLILLEEVDVLFEEDKLFWATVLELTLQSKRPIIMTCTDERLLPLDDIALHAIFRFGPPPDQLAVDYLLLLACNEGHLLPREAVSALYNAKQSDLRASIAELNFWCQMAIGDVKGGLEWMLIRSTADEHQEPGSESTRVVSEGTYQKGMGWLSGDLSSETDPSICQETELLLEAWNGWGVDVGGNNDYIIGNVRIRPGEASGRQAIEELKRFEQACEALSAADTYPACVSRGSDMVCDPVASL